MSRMDEIKESGQMARISLRCGLSVEACEEMFSKGWTFQDALDCTPRWIAPLNLTRRRE